MEGAHEKRRERMAEMEREKPGKNKVTKEKETEIQEGQATVAKIFSVR